MKKLILALLAIVGTVTFNQINAQTTGSVIKIGVFNSEDFMQNLPEFRTVDSLVSIYSRDSLGGQFDLIQSEFHRLDSTYKADSAAKASPTKLNYTMNERNKNAQILINWQRYAQQAQQSRYYQLAQPLYLKVNQAVEKVCTQQHIAFVLKPDAFDYVPKGSSTIVDISLPVAKLLGLPVNEEPAAKPAAGTRK